MALAIGALGRCITDETRFCPKCETHQCGQGVTQDHLSLKMTDLVSTFMHSEECYQGCRSYELLESRSKVRDCERWQTPVFLPRERGNHSGDSVWRYLTKRFSRLFSRFWGQFLFQILGAEMSFIPHQKTSKRTRNRWQAVD